MIDLKETARFVNAAQTLEEHLGGIVEGYMRCLNELDSPLVMDIKRKRQVEIQARSVLEDTVRVLRGLQTPPDGAADDFSDTIGEMRAIDGVHPSESLRAAEALSGATLAVVADNLPPSPTSLSEVAGVALAIQHSIMERLTRASISYVDYLLRKVHEAHADERREISRELREQVAHSLTSICQSLELYELFKDLDAPRAQEKLEFAKDAAHNSIGRVKDISEELRQAAYQDTLETALSDLLRDNIPPGLRSRVLVEGDGSLVPPYVREELLLILREGIRNAAAQPTVHEVAIVVRAAPSEVVSIIERDGKAVGSEEKPSADDAALESMRERVSLLRGTLRVRSRRGSPGTLVEVKLPLARSGKSVPSEQFSAQRLPSRILVADGHELFRQGIVEMLETDPENIEVVGEAESDAEAVALVREKRPSVILMDLELPTVGAKETIRKIASVSPSSKIIILAMYEDPNLARDLMDSGVHAYAVKNATRRDLLSAVRAVAEGESSVVLSVSGNRPEKPKASLKETLSERQLEILLLASRGKSNREIAASLHISESTVKRHLANIYAKLKVNSRKEAAAKVFTEGFLK